MTAFRTEQEAFWAGEFGDQYIERNQGAGDLAGNLALFARALRVTQKITSVIEFGANIGMNMRALRPLLPEAELSAVEINAKAYGMLSELPYVKATHGSLLDHELVRAYDLVLVKGVLIHLDPGVLAVAYDKIFAASGRYVLLSEYYSLTPMEVDYRGHSGRLFKRDFAGELMQRHPSLQLLDYGFMYHRDQKWFGEDANWFLMEKR